LAASIVDMLNFDFNVQYDEKDSIGKRYRRQDAIGTPLCVTVDHDSLDDHCVTIRHRDTMTQERVAIADLPAIVAREVSLSSLFAKLSNR
ncbi:MAG: His/Gly/Thr/Pro-type tRNA ligase C-terminal domain-containing protein, partial [Mucinivorans sp.]